MFLPSWDGRKQGVSFRRMLILTWPWTEEATTCTVSLLSKCLGAVNLMGKFLKVKNNSGKVVIFNLGYSSVLLMARPHRQVHWHNLEARLLSWLSLLEDVLVKLWRGDAVCNGKGCFLITAELERTVMLEQDLEEAGQSFALPTLAAGDVLGTKALQAPMCSVKQVWIKSCRWFLIGCSAGLGHYVGIPAVRAAIDKICYVWYVTNRNVVWDSIMCTTPSDESLIYLSVFIWRLLNLEMWIDVANGLPTPFPPCSSCCFKQERFVELSVLTVK